MQSIYFDILNCLVLSSSSDRQREMDGRTGRDFVVTNAALHYMAKRQLAPSPRERGTWIWAKQARHVTIWYWSNLHMHAIHLHSLSVGLVILVSIPSILWTCDIRTFIGYLIDFIILKTSACLCLENKIIEDLASWSHLALYLIFEHIHRMAPKNHRSELIMAGFLNSGCFSNFFCTQQFLKF